MPALQGLDWVGSQDKLHFDEQFRDRFGPIAALVEANVAALIGRDLEPGTEEYFIHYRQTAKGEIPLPKLRTMGGEDDDNNPSLSKANPRIVSKLAWLVRDLALDELPQIGLLGQDFSVVGPRPQHKADAEYYLEVVSRYDRGLARAYEDEILGNPAIRTGLTGPLQLKWLWEDARHPRMIIKGVRADLRYYPDKATRARDVAIIASTPPQLIISTLWKRACGKRSIAALGVNKPAEALLDPEADQDEAAV